MVRLLSNFIQRWSTWSYKKNLSIITQTAFADDTCIQGWGRCTHVLCTHVLEYIFWSTQMYSSLLCTHVLLAWCTQYLYSSTFIKYSYFQSTFWVLFHKQCYYFDINDIDDIFILQLLNMMHTVIYQDYQSCFLSPIQVYVCI